MLLIGDEKLGNLGKKSGISSEVEDVPFNRLNPSIIPVQVWCAIKETYPWVTPCK
jgi:hypothetical protein